MEGTRIGGRIRVKENHLEPFVEVHRTVDHAGEVVARSKVLSRIRIRIRDIYAPRQSEKIPSYLERVDPLFELGDDSSRLPCEPLCDLARHFFRNTSLFCLYISTARWKVF